MNKKTLFLLICLAVSSIVVGHPTTDKQPQHERGNKTSDEVDLLQRYVDLSRSFVNENIDSAKHYALLGIAESKRLKNDSILSKLYNSLAVAAISSGDGEYALHLLDSAIAIDKKLGDRRSLAASIGNKGSVNYLLGR